MSTITQGLDQLSWLRGEGNVTISREQVIVTVAGAVALPSGTVLGRITATGKYVKYNNGAADGSQVAAGILAYGLPGVNGDYKALAFVRDCEVIGSLLDNGTTPAAECIAELRTLGIVVR
jgi:hypothetical protein